MKLLTDSAAVILTTSRRQQLLVSQLPCRLKSFFIFTLLAKKIVYKNPNKTKNNPTAPPTSTTAPNTPQPIIAKRQRAKRAVRGSPFATHENFFFLPVNSSGFGKKLKHPATP